MREREKELQIMSYNTVESMKLERNNKGIHEQEEAYKKYKKSKKNKKKREEEEGEDNLREKCSGV